VVAGDSHFRSFPLPGATGGERFVLFGVPWDIEGAGSIELFAEDDAGNRSTKRAVDGFRARAPHRDVIRLGDPFLERVVPAILSQTPELDRGGSLLEQYLRINGELREANRARLAELSGRTEEIFLWSGPFLQMPNSARKANYAEVRTYMYGGREVDTQTHLGLDLASIARADVPAPNGCIVRYAGFLGIYGNVVVLDHGFGLTSVNAHLSSIVVEVGQRVAKGETIGRTGATGLAGGDHLHLGLFIQGTAVDPIEWLDPRWIERNLADRLPLDAQEAAVGAPAS
jgi:murein DD-endopeptidase MepM/ murein hydrolase activator NlpD